MGSLRERYSGWRSSPSRCNSNSAPATSIIGGGRSDERIELAVMTALHWDLAVPRDRVQVSVEGGWVTLTGQVERDYERSRAEADARTIQASPE